MDKDLGPKVYMEKTNSKVLIKRDRREQNLDGLKATKHLTQLNTVQEPQ